MKDEEIIDNHLIKQKKSERSISSKLLEYASLFVFAIGLFLLYLDYPFGVYFIYSGLIGSLVSFFIFTYFYYQKKK